MQLISPTPRKAPRQARKASPSSVRAGRLEVRDRPRCIVKPLRIAWIDGRQVLHTTRALI
ncbi:hypothetical protein [Tardiphaga sp. OK246]|uniref:hypothetical protein n=1 Tax=Tardiphaga sp. OK246 TaxID=1855307 RepID=UPI001FCD8D2B|nr:hypothetical protein [Tardiphaga sp. OK246]